MTSETDFYFDQVLKLKEDVGKIESEVFQKVLLASLLDTLAFVACPKSKTRFVDFITEYSSWAYVYKISAAQIKYRIEKRGTPGSLSNLHRYTSDIVDSWIPGTKITPDYDTSIKDYDIFKDVEERKIIRTATYPQLIKRMRNTNVHELRFPGRGFMLFKYNETPYYFHSDPSKTWELYISLEVMNTILDKCIVNLKNHCKTKSINPFDQYYEGSVW